MLNHNKQHVNVKTTKYCKSNKNFRIIYNICVYNILLLKPKMFGICRNGLNIFPTIQYQRSVFHIYKNSPEINVAKSLIKAKQVSNPAIRHFAVFENQHTTSRWLKLFGELNSKGRVGVARSFRQKVLC